MKTSFFLPPELLITSTAQCGPDLLKVCQAVETAGFDACNLTDHPAPTREWRYRVGHDAFDPFAAFCYIAAATTRIRLHTHIVVLPYRNPFVVAKSIATLDVLSGGRTIFGIGAGYMLAEYAALGVDFPTRGKAMDEAIPALKAAWSGETVNMRGSTFVAEDILPQPIPLQRPHPPIWGGGNSKAAIRRAAALCNGWSPFFVEPEDAVENATGAMVNFDDLRRLTQFYLDERERADRTDPFDICVNPPDRPQTRNAAAKQVYLDQAGKLKDIGVTWSLLSLPGKSVPDLLDSIAWFGEEVLPALRTL